MKTIIVYYSLEGNTDYAAKRIASEIGADTLRIKPVKEIPRKGLKKFLWGGKSAVMAQTPALEAYDCNLDDYDRIVIGFPVWAGNITPPVRTFIMENDMTGKKVAAYACQSGSGAEKAFDKLKKALGIPELESTLILIDPKDRPSEENEKKISEFCEKLKDHNPIQIEPLTSFKTRDPLAWEEVYTEQIIKDEWIDLRRSAWRLPDGTVFEPFYSYSRRDFAVIVASDTDGNYLCVRQFRHGIRKVTTEFPAGGIERKDGKGFDSWQDVSGNVSMEDALLAAKRELLEETGHESDDWEYMLSVPSNASLADNYAHLFVARNCRKVSGQDLDETEFLKVIKVPADKIDEMIEAGQFQQAIHITAWFLSLRKNDGE